MHRQRAMLLVGPTGSGKTPLGERLDAQGLWGRRCCHFDFGKHLRAVAANELRPDGWTDADTAFVRDVLLKGALLEKSAFHLAERLLAQFTEAARLGPDDLLVLNGWPRHAEQAETVDLGVDVGLVAHLDCAEVEVRARIRGDAGGDRTGRADDSEPDVSRKWRVYKKRTEPLLDHYRRKGVQVVALDVDTETSSGDLVRCLEGANDPWSDRQAARSDRT